MRVGTVTLAVGLIVLIAHTCVATTEGYTSEAGSVQKQEQCAGKTLAKLEIEGGIEGCKTVGESGKTIEISSGEMKVMDIKSGAEWKLRIVGESCENESEGGATRLTVEAALKAASSEEEKAVEEREVEEYMDHEQGGSFLICMSAEYRKKLEVELKEKHGAKWEVYYWTTLLRDVDVHYSGNMSVSDRAKLREEYKNKYGVSWRLYYWRYVSQSIEYHLDGSKIEELKTKYGEEWRFYYEAYGHWFSYKHEDHREWFKGLTEKDFEDIAKQVELAEAEEKKSEKERSVDIYMDHVGTGKDGMKYADSMSKEWRENLAKDLKVKYGEQWEIPYWMQMTTDIDENYQGSLSSDDRTKLRWSVIMKYGNEWRKYYWRVLSQDMEMYLDGDLINSLKAQYNDHWRLHYGPYSQWFEELED
ncbi:unnamed protein product [Calicophoron daubneyi]|uniref:Uncharacterized protein n=1 Tax=Calicophoron daubneyi TaxID=300641 RepID=A0AAV2TMI2_CALDB